MSFNATQFTVFGIPPYVFFAGLGVLIAFFVFNCLLLHLKANIKQGNRAVVFSIPMLLIGAKLFGVIANIARNIEKKEPITIDTFIYSGIVFYGGLIFFTFFFFLYIRKYSKEDKIKITDSLACAIPVFHAFGRIGCFTAGCCYGISTASWFSIDYTTWVDGAVSSDMRVPIQLIEAAANLMIFVMLLLLILRKKCKGELIFVYIILYSSIRFVDEFFRGDNEENIFGIFSAAQIISIALIFVALLILMIVRSKKCLKKMNG